MLSIPRLPKTVGQARTTALAAEATPTHRARLARRLAAQMRRRRAGVAPLTPAKPQIPSWKMTTDLPTERASKEAVELGFEWLRALREKGWLGPLDLESLTEGSRLFDVVASAIKAQIQAHSKAVQDCLPASLFPEQSLCLVVEGLQELHAGLCSGRPLAEPGRLFRVTVEACNPFVLEHAYRDTLGDRIVRGAWDALAKAMGYERMAGTDDSLGMCHPMLDELLRDALLHSRVVDGKRVLDEHVFDVFEAEMGWDPSDPEQRELLTSKVEDYANHVATAATRAPISPTSTQGRQWLRTAPESVARRVNALMALAKVVRRSTRLQVETDREGMFAGCIGLLEMVPGFEAEADEFLQCLGSEPEVEAYSFDSAVQFLDALPHVIVTTAAANAAFTLMLEHIRDE